MNLRMPSALQRVHAALQVLFGSQPGRIDLHDALRREQEQAARHLQDLELIAFHDSLTGLPNRRRLQDLLREAIDRCAAEPQHEFSLLFLDFDRFKLINDTLGHTAGDQFLARVSRLLVQQLRPGDAAARLGGDEFAILVQGSGSARHAVRLAQGLIERLSVPMCLDGVSVSATASIGITSSSIGYTEPGEVLRDADIAMYRAKSAGKARYAVFDVALRREVSRRRLLENALREALARSELQVEYQPIFHMGRHRLLGFEALLRWEHPKLGAVSPAQFMPIAQECGLATRLTDFALQQACAWLRQQQAGLPEGDSLVMHLDLSGSDLDDEHLPTRLRHACTAAAIGPHHLVLELTESVLMTRGAQARPMLHELRTLGFQLSADHFGTGHSSLAQLCTLPLASLKIDGSFVAGLDDGGNCSVVRAIVALGRALGLPVIAQGIETPLQLQQLQALGCEAGQGPGVAAVAHAAAAAA